MAQIKIKANLPNGSSQVLKFPQRATIEQVKMKFFEQLHPKFRKEPYYILVGSSLLETEFHKFCESTQGVVDSISEDKEIEINFITLTEAEEREFEKKLKNLNSEWDAKIKELEDEERTEEDTFNSQVEALHKRGT